MPLRLMTDYNCDPLWDSESEEINIDPRSLQITKDLQESLARWADWYTSTLNLDDPKLSGFASDEEAEHFEAEGMRLWKLLQIQLPNNRVQYFSVQANRLMDSPD